MELAIVLGAVAAVTGLCWLMRDITGYWPIAWIYLALISFLATQPLGYAAIVAAAVAGGLAWNFFFVPPVFGIRIKHFQDAVVFVTYFAVAVLIGRLTTRLRQRELEVRNREHQTAALYRLAQGLADSASVEEALAHATQETARTFGTDCHVVLAGADGRPGPGAASAGMRGQPAIRWQSALETLRAAARPGTCAAPMTMDGWLHLPLHTARRILGLMSLRTDERGALAPEECDLVNAFADRIAAMVERYDLIAGASRTKLAEESERVYKTVLDCVSHELKTPLAVLQAAADSLSAALEPTGGAMHGARELVGEIQTASSRLGRIVDGLLSMTRLDAGRYRLDPVWCDVDEIIASARLQVADLLAGHDVAIKMPPDMPSVRVDSGFVEQALANLLANAAAYSPPEARISLEAGLVDEAFLVLQVSDCGPGLPDGDTERVFEKFYRGPMAPPGGVGLGLSVVRGLMHALGGEVTAQNSHGQGATFILRMPVEVRRIPESA